MVVPKVMLSLEMFKFISLVQTLKVEIDNIHTLSEKQQAYLSCFSVSAKEFYIFRQCIYIMFILQC